MGMLADVSELSLDDLCSSDAAFNFELAWLAFNWRVLSLASAVGLLAPQLSFWQCIVQAHLPVCRCNLK